MDHKPPGKPQEPSSVRFIREKDEPCTPMPTFVRTKSLSDLLGTRSLDTLESTPSTPAKASLKARQAAVTNALANQRLEGLEPEAQVVLDLKRFARGECEISAVLNNFKARIARGEVFRQR